MTLWLFPDSGELRDQEPDQRFQQRLTSSSDVVNELEEAQVERWFLLGNAPVRTEPRSEQRPEAFQGEDMDLAGPITIVVAGELAGRVTDGVMDGAPFRQPSVDVIFICVNYRNLGNHLSDQGPDRRLLDILQHPDDDLAGALERAEDRRFLLLQRPRPGASFSRRRRGGRPFF